MSTEILMDVTLTPWVMIRVTVPAQFLQTVMFLYAHIFITVEAF